MMRRTHTVRSALTQALRSGATGTFDMLASHAGLSAEYAPSAQITLANMAREGKVTIIRTYQASAARGRPRAVYALASTVQPERASVALGPALCAAWR